MQCHDPNERLPRVLAAEDVLELRTVVLATGGEDAEALIAHYEAVIDNLKTQLERESYRHQGHRRPRPESDDAHQV